MRIQHPIGMQYPFFHQATNYDLRRASRRGGYLGAGRVGNGSGVVRPAAGSRPFPCSIPDSFATGSTSGRSTALGCRASRRRRQLPRFDNATLGQMGSAHGLCCDSEVLLIDRGRRGIAASTSTETASPLVKGRTWRFTSPAGAALIGTSGGGLPAGSSTRLLSAWTDEAASSSAFYAPMLVPIAAPRMCSVAGHMGSDAQGRPEGLALTTKWRPRSSQRRGVADLGGGFMSSRAHFSVVERRVIPGRSERQGCPL